MTILVVLQLGYYRKLSLTVQWQFRRVDTMDQGAPLQNCHWPVIDSFGGSTPWTKMHLYKTVIDQSMTILAGIGMGYHRKLSLTSQWQFSEGRHHVGMCTFTKLSLTGQWHFSLREWVITENCHWPVNDISAACSLHWKLSLTGQWHFVKVQVPPWSQLNLSFLMRTKIVIDRSMTIFCDNPFLMQAKIVIDQSMAFS